MALFKRKRHQRILFKVPEVETPLTFMGDGYLTWDDADLTIRIEHLDSGDWLFVLGPKMSEEELSARTDRQVRARYGLAAAGLGGA